MYLDLKNQANTQGLDTRRKVVLQYCLGFSTKEVWMNHCNNKMITCLDDWVLFCVWKVPFSALALDVEAEDSERCESGVLPASRGVADQLVEHDLDLQA